MFGKLLKILQFLPVEGSEKAKKLAEKNKKSAKKKPPDSPDGFNGDGKDETLGIVSRQHFHQKLRALESTFAILRRESLLWFADVEDPTLDKLICQVALHDSDEEVRIAAVEILCARTLHEVTADRMQFVIRLVIESRCRHVHKEALNFTRLILTGCTLDEFKERTSFIENTLVDTPEDKTQKEYRARILRLAFKLSRNLGLAIPASPVFVRWFLSIVILDAGFSYHERLEAMSHLTQFTEIGDVLDEFSGYDELEEEQQKLMIPERFFFSEHDILRGLAQWLIFVPNPMAYDFLKTLLTQYRRFNPADDNPTLQRIAYALHVWEPFSKLVQRGIGNTPHSGI